jgi:hypothetical protein
MIRTGYLRWEIDVADARSVADATAREVTFGDQDLERLEDFGPEAVAEWRSQSGEAGICWSMEADLRAATILVGLSNPRISRRHVTVRSLLRHR